MAASLPRFAKGQKIGLLGGSFNPPHEGHHLITRIALTRLRLDRVWWMVTPGNPMKSLDELATLDDRVDKARALFDDPRVAVTGFEEEIGARYTCDSILFLRARAPGVKFVWLMGADNLRQFHLWRHWRAIANAVPIAVIDRPGSTLKVLASPAAQAMARYRIPEGEAAHLADRPAPAFVFLHGPRSTLSSTALRRRKAGFE